MKASEARTLRVTLKAVGMALQDEGPEIRAEVANAIQANLTAYSTVSPAMIETVPGWIEDGAESLVPATVAKAAARFTG